MNLGLRSGAVAAGVVMAGFAVGVAPAAGDTVNFPYVAPTATTPNPYAEWTVPPGVTEATFDLYGAQGAGVKGGKGAHVTSVVQVTPNTTYRVYVGGAGQAPAGGYNGGGNGGPPTGDIFALASNGGGGATDLRTATPFSLSERLLVAAGGGGDGSEYSTSEDVAAGGASDADGANVGTDVPDAGLFLAHGGRSGSQGGAGGTGQDIPGAGSFDCPSGSDGTTGTGGAGSQQSFFCPQGGGGGGGLLGGGGGGGGTSGAGGGGSNKVENGTVTNGVREGDGQASVTFTPSDQTVKIDGPLTPFASNGSSRFKLGTVLEVRVKPTRGGQLITDLKPQVNIVRTGNPSGPQNPTVAVLKRSADAGKTARYSAQFGQYQFYAATLKSQFNAGKDLTPGGYRVDVADPVFPGGAHKVARNFAIVP